MSGVAVRSTVGAAVDRRSLPRPMPAPVVARVAPVVRSTPCTCGRGCAGEVGWRDCLDSQVYNRLLFAAQLDASIARNLMRASQARARGCYVAHIEEWIRDDMVLLGQVRAQADLARRMRDGEL